MRFVSETSSGGVVEQLFTLGEIPGVLWTPAGAAGVRPLILMGHGGGQHKKAPGVAARAHRFVTAGGFAASGGSRSIGASTPLSRGSRRARP